MTKQEIMKKMKLSDARLNFLFKNNCMPKYQGMLWVTFAFGTGINHECDDVIYALREEIGYCLKKLSVIFKINIQCHNFLRLVANYNKSSMAFLLNFTGVNFEDRHSLVVTPKEIFLLKNASDKCYLYLLENGCPLVTFASNIAEGRGVFDGEYLYFGNKVTSSLPERLRMKVEGNTYGSKYFYKKDDVLMVDGKKAKTASFTTTKGVKIIEFTHKKSKN